MLAKMLIQSLFGAIFLAALLFLPAGDWAWPQAWAFLVLFSFCGLGIGFWLLKFDPELAAARMRSPLSGDQNPRDRAIAAAILVVFCIWFIFMALDARRFGWSNVPIPMQVLGALLILMSFWGWVAVLRANSFAATNIRVQGERNQTVISSGPYAMVRHPMYAYTIPFSFGTPLLLGSCWGLLGLIPFFALIIARTLGEEAVLRQSLAGYVDYSNRVRYRLLPGVW